MVEIVFIVSQDACAKPVLSVFKILIKKELMFFTNGCPSLATLGGAHLFTNWKSYVQFEKIKTKKRLCTV